jgi:hypothetical protein
LRGKGIKRGSDKKNKKCFSISKA